MQFLAKKLNFIIASFSCFEQTNYKTICFFIKLGKYFPEPMKEMKQQLNLLSLNKIKCVYQTGTGSLGALGYHGLAWRLDRTSHIPY